VNSSFEETALAAAQKISDAEQVLLAKIVTESDKVAVQISAVKRITDKNCINNLIDIALRSSSSELKQQIISGITDYKYAIEYIENIISNRHTPYSAASCANMILDIYRIHKTTQLGALTSRYNGTKLYGDHTDTPGKWTTVTKHIDIYSGPHVDHDTGCDVQPCSGHDDYYEGDHEDRYETSRILEGYSNRYNDVYVRLD
jgi:hypothetical protein